MNTVPSKAPRLVRIPPPVWTFAMLLIAFSLQRMFGWAAMVYFHSTLLAIIFAVMGLALAISAERKFAAAGTEIMPASPANKVLVTGGVFGFTRNPMYLGLIMVTFGIALYFGTLPFFAVPLLLFVLVNAVFIPFEEAKMQRQHGASYTDYRARVRRWL